MSATLHPYTPPPTVQDQSPWAKALAGGRQATMFDSGSNQLPQGFNPWQDYQNPSDNAGWNYTTDPNFNAAKNVKRWGLAQTGAGSEDDRAKAYRLAFDYLNKKYQITSPGTATQQQMDEALLYGIQRVKTDLSAPENAAMGGWQNSPWYGYDQYLQGGSGATQQGGARGGGSGVGGGMSPLVNDPLASFGATQQGGARAQGGWSSTPNTLGGSVDYGTGQQQGGSGSQSQQGGQRSGSGAANPYATTGTPWSSGGNPATGGGTGGQQGSGNGGNGTFGQMTGFDPTFAFNAAQQDPGVAAHYLRLAQGQTGPITSRLGNFRDNLYGKSLQAYLALNGVGSGGQSGPADMQTFLQAMQSGNVGALLDQAAARVGNADFTGQQDTDVEKALRAAAALRSVNMGSLGSTMMGNDLNNMLYNQEGAGLATSGNDMTGLGSRLRSDQYGQQFRRYLASL